MAVTLILISMQGKLVVGRTQAVFFYEVDGRGACFVFQVPPLPLLLLVSVLDKQGAAVTHVITQDLKPCSRGYWDE
jgi:hypothetical protein